MESTKYLLHPASPPLPYVAQRLAVATVPPASVAAGVRVVRAPEGQPRAPLAVVGEVLSEKKRPCKTIA